MKNIGITGGIGGGKSFVASIFTDLGYLLYPADARARELMVSDPALIAGVKALFGQEAYFEDGSLNRELIGSIVFKDEEKLKALNSLVHPATARDFLKWVSEVPTAYDLPFVLKEAAILYESGAWVHADGIIVVSAPEELRIERVMRRDGLSREEVLDRVARQWPESEKLRRADFIIVNNGKEALLPQVREAIRFFGDGD